MNVFNRILSVLFMLIVAVGGAVALIAPAATLQMAQQLANFGHNLLGELPAGLRLVARIAMAGLFSLFMAVLLWLELRRPQAKSVEVQRAQGGKIKLTTSDIQRRIGESVSAVDGVRSTKVFVDARNKSVAARVEVVTEPGFEPVSKGEEIAESTRAIIEDQLGLKMFAKPHVTVQVGKLAKGIKMPAMLGGPRKPDAILPAAGETDIIDAPSRASP